MNHPATTAHTATGAHADPAAPAAIASVARAVCLAAWCVCLVCLLAMGRPVAAQQATAVPSPWRTQIEGVLATSRRPGAPDDAARIEIEVGSLDPRLRLAPCARAEAYLPAGMKPWGRIRMGLRCVQGEKPWNVFVPVTVRVWGHALVAAADLPAGTVLAASDLRPARVDLAAEHTAVFTDAAVAVGRELQHNLRAGSALRAGHLKPRRYFAAGEAVRLLVRGPGFQVRSAGWALAPGDEGQCVRIRTESGRVVCGRPGADRVVEVTL